MDNIAEDSPGGRLKSSLPVLLIIAFAVCAAIVLDTRTRDDAAQIAAPGALKSAVVSALPLCSWDENLKITSEVLPGFLSEEPVHAQRLETHYRPWEKDCRANGSKRTATYTRGEYVVEVMLPDVSTSVNATVTWSIYYSDGTSRKLKQSPAK